MSAREIAARYVELFNSKQFDQVGELWAGDGVAYNGFGQVLEGKSAIKSFYSAFYGQDIPPIRARSFMEDKEKNVCAVEIEMQLVQDDEGNWTRGPEGSFAPASLDQFYLDDQGKVKKMIAYMAPPGRWEHS